MACNINEPDFEKTTDFQNTFANELKKQMKKDVEVKTQYIPENLEETPFHNANI